MTAAARHGGEFGGDEGGEREKRARSCRARHARAPLGGNRPTLANADIKDTLAAYFKTKERWIYKAG